MIDYCVLEDTYRKIFVFNDEPESVDILDTATTVSTVPCMYARDVPINRKVIGKTG